MKRPRPAVLGIVSFLLGIASLAVYAAPVWLTVVWSRRTGYSDEPWSNGELGLFIAAMFSSFLLAIAGQVLGNRALLGGEPHKRLANSGVVMSLVASALFFVAWLAPVGSCSGCW